MKTKIRELFYRLLPASWRRSRPAIRHATPPPPPPPDAILVDVDSRNSMLIGADGKPTVMELEPDQHVRAAIRAWEMELEAKPTAQDLEPDIALLAAIWAWEVEVNGQSDCSVEISVDVKPRVAASHESDDVAVSGVCSPAPHETMRGWSLPAPCPSASTPSSAELGQADTVMVSVPTPIQTSKIYHNIGASLVLPPGWRRG